MSTSEAYSLLKSDFDLPPVEIRLEKRTAVGAGLGGGSADAAFTLMALTEMFQLGLEDWQLADYAACLGSDCPIFIYATGCPTTTSTCPATRSASRCRRACA